MLAWFVKIFDDANVVAPASILVLFIVVVIALTWCLLTLFLYHHRPITSRFIGYVDTLLIGAFIAGVYYLRDIRHADCITLSRSGSFGGDFAGITVSGPEFSLDTDKSCAMLKASWAFGIICCLTFPVSSLAALHYSRSYLRKHSPSSTQRVYV